MTSAWHGDFERTGWVVLTAERRDVLDALRERVAAVAADHLGLGCAPQLEELHLLLDDVESSERLRMWVTEELRCEMPAGRLVFQCFESALGTLVGPDVLAQRSPNVVLQPPGHPIPTELHRDAPANSPYEIVVWLPLVDCFGTKSMYLLDRDATEGALSAHAADPDDHAGFDRLLLETAVPMEVPYGSALLFWTGLLHGSRVNRETTTRVSLNTRYKSLLAPVGMKDPYRYFEILRSSPLTRLGLGFEPVVPTPGSHPE